MKIKTFSNMSRRVLAVILCLLFATATLTMISCNNDTETPDNEEPKATEAPDTLVEVLRFVKDVKAGEAITEDALELVSLRDVDIPINAMKDKSAIVGKYAVSDLFKGDFVFPIKLSATPLENDEDVEFPDEDLTEINYTLITKYHSLAKDGDYTAAIKKAIEENPAATIYFPDGEYGISETIVIPAGAEKGVSFRLSNFATIKALNWTDKSAPMIRIGVESATAEGEKDIFDIRNTYIMGGVIDAAGKASGISLEGGYDITLSNITIANAYNGLTVKCAPNELGATCADIENVNVIGTKEKGSIGVLVEGTHNTFTNMKISDVQYALKCTETGSNNVFRSIMAIGTALSGTDNAGFWDLSDGNQYDICYSDQFATGFLISERARSVYNGCAASWWSADNDYHVGFRAEGKLNSTILYSRVQHEHEVATDAYLLVGADGGSGNVQYPIVQIVSDEYASVLDKYCDTDILH
ncbi:MAG: hypothetical protein E7642_05320 [Ruminococcaceae bacterium]|nr:hypothetical protein [Oscillospiraceae bacterium]